MEKSYSSYKGDFLNGKRIGKWKEYRGFYSDNYYWVINKSNSIFAGEYFYNYRSKGK